jgi:putative transposase
MSVARISVRDVTEVVTVRVLPTKAEAAALQATLTTCNSAASQPAIRVIGKVAHAYASLRTNIDAGNYGPPGSPKRKKVAATPIGFRADAAQPFDARCLSWQIPQAVGAREATVSIWTTQGRCKRVRVLAGRAA